MFLFSFYQLISSQIQITAWPKDDDIVRHFLPWVLVRASLCRSVERGAQLCLPRCQRADLHLSRKKSLCSSLWECVGVGRARQSDLANERVRDRKASLLKPAIRRPHWETWTARGDGDGDPVLVIMLNNNSADCNRTGRTNSASPLHGSLVEGQQFAQVQHLLTSSLASGVVFTDSRGGRDSLAPKVQKYRML